MSKSPEIWLPSGVDRAVNTEVDEDDPERTAAIADEIAALPFDKTVASVCTVPTGSGTLCLHPFFEGEDERHKVEHIKKCVARHEQEIHEEHERLHPSVLKPWDTEFADYVNANREAILSGRMSAF